MKATQIKNLTGIKDDEILNAACECERKDDLADEIARKITKSHGFESLYRNNVFSFAKVCAILSEYGFTHVIPDDYDCELEQHRFVNETNGDTIYLFPVNFYPNLNKFRFANFLLS